MTDARSEVPTDTSTVDDGRHEPPPPKETLAPNDGKSLTVRAGEADWARVPIQTGLFARGDDLEAKVVAAVEGTVEAARADGSLGAGFDRPWYVLLSEKIVAITQGRSYFTWEIRTGLPARVLAKFVQRTPHGLGLGTPWTMQLAIQEAGLPRILLASGASVVGKLLGRKGVFYKVAGHRVNAIDGPTPYSAYPSNVSAKLPPKDPDQVCTRLAEALRAKLPEELGGNLRGVVVIDSNDLGREVLGSDADKPAEFFCELFRDNPFGQGRQQTPIAVCLQVDSEARA